MSFPLLQSIVTEMGLGDAVIPVSAVNRVTEMGSGDTAIPVIQSKRKRTHDKVTNSSIIIPDPQESSFLHQGIHVFVAPVQGIFIEMKA
jgi:hypothetical protein